MNRLESLEAVEAQVREALDQDEVFRYLTSLPDRDNADKRLIEICVEKIVADQETALAEMAEQNAELSNKMIVNSEIFATKELEYLTALRNLKAKVEEKDHEINDLSNQVTAMAGHLETTKQNLEKCKEAMRDSQAVIKSAEDDKARITTENQRELGSLRWEIDDLKRRLEESEKRCKEEAAEIEKRDCIWKQRLEEERNKRQELSKSKIGQNSRLTSDLEGDWMSVDKQLKEKMELQYQMKIVEEIAALEEKYKLALKEEAEKICKTLANQYNYVIEDLRGKKTALDSECQLKDEKLRELNSELRKLREELEQKDLIEAKLKGDRDFWKNLHAEMNEEHLSLKGDHSKLMIAHDLLSADLKASEESSKAHQASYNKLREDYARLEKLMIDKKSSQDAKSAEIMNLTMKLDDTSGKLEHAINELQESKLSSERLQRISKSQAESLKQEIEDLKNRIRSNGEEKNKQMAELKEKIKEVKSEKEKESLVTQKRLRGFVGLILGFREVLHKEKLAWKSAILEAESSLKQQFALLKNHIEVWKRSQEAKASNHCQSFKDMMELAVRSEEGKTFRLKKELEDREEEINDLRIGSVGSKRV